MECRSGCGACCIAPSIAQPFYGMPDGKAAGVRCAHLAGDFRCLLFGDPRRPALCGAFAAEGAICGTSREHALYNLQHLEVASAPGGAV